MVGLVTVGFCCLVFLSCVPSPGASSIILDNLNSTCVFRNYPLNRFYYGSVQQKNLHTMDANTPSFLKDVDYIYGQAPFVLTGDDLIPLSKGKICTTEPKYAGEEVWGTGTNPSFLSRERVLAHLPSNHSVVQALQHYPETTLIGTIVFKDGAGCVLNGTGAVSLNPDDRKSRTELLFLNDRFETLISAPIQFEPARGRKTGHRIVRHFDDTRLFLHNGLLWISYKDYYQPTGYDLQFLSPVHMEYSANTSNLRVFTRGKEITAICCGRNIAILENPASTDNNLSYLKTIEPVLVEHSLVHRNYRPPKESKTVDLETSNYHGTSGYLVKFKRDELLGIGHFHRGPLNRSYAEFGHHYTHSFFTISEKAPHSLQRLSGEFVFQAKTGGKEDAEIIQFATGLEIIEREGKTFVLIGYGLNDCEAAGIFVDLERVDGLLKAVGKGETVSKNMKRVLSWAQ